MRADGVKNTAHIDQARTIELQRPNRGAACRRQARHERKIFILDEILRPNLRSRIEQQRGNQSYRVKVLSAVSLVLVTTNTSQRRIFGYRRPAEAARVNVVNRQRVG